MILRSLATSAGLPVTSVETPVTNLVRNPVPGLTNQDRVDFVINKAGRKFAFDQTVHQVTRTMPLSSSMAAFEQKKKAKYSNILNENNIKFSPIVLSALGYADTSFKDYVDFCVKTAKQNHIRLSVNFFLNRLSVALAIHAGKMVARSYYNMVYKKFILLVISKVGYSYDFNLKFIFL